MINVLPKASAEENITFALARSEKPLTHYQLWKKHKVAASNKTVLVTLKRLEENKTVKSRQEQKGRKRKFYNLTVFGLIASLTYDRAWQFIDEIAKAQKDMLPKVFGKWAFFKKEHILDEVIERLKSVVWRLWKLSTYYPIIPQTLSVYLEIDRNRAHKKLAFMKTKYEHKVHWLVSDLTKLVFGIDDLPFLPIGDPDTVSQMGREREKELKLKLERQKKLLQILRRDPDLKNYIDKQLQFDKMMLKFKMEKIEAWKKWIQSVESHPKRARAPI